MVDNVILKQFDISDEAKVVLVKIRIDGFNKEIDVLSENLYSGKITLGMWEEDFRTRLREFMGGVTMIAKGGAANVTPADWGRLGAYMKKQYNWLHGFSQAIYENRDTITLAAIKGRSHLYGDSGNTVASQAQAGAFRDLLPWIPGDETAECWHRCGCRWLLNVMGEDEKAGTQTVSATWVLNPIKEHCKDCEPRDGHEEIVEVPIGTEVPVFIGLGG